MRARDKLARIVGIENVYAPVKAGPGRPVFWLGSLILARWDADDPHMWHDVARCDGVGQILGASGARPWPPMTVPDAALALFKEAVAREDAKLSGGYFPEDDNPPCAAGDAVRFSYLAFLRCSGHCLWVYRGIVGVKIRMLGYDHLLQVPYEFVEKPQEIVAPQFGQPRAGTKRARI